MVLKLPLPESEDRLTVVLLVTFMAAPMPSWLSIVKALDATPAVVVIELFGKPILLKVKVNEQVTGE